MNARKGWPTGPNEKKSSRAVSAAPTQASRAAATLLVAYLLILQGLAAGAVSSARGLLPSRAAWLVRTLA